MKKIFITFLVTLLCHTYMMADYKASLVQDQPTSQNQIQKYRRSSLCILLVTHQGTKYAADMERQFLKMKLPERYNEHNIKLRVLHTDKSLKAKDISKLLANNEVGKQLVARWFNRDPYTGVMNMDLIHERGGYNASLSDAERADMTVRGRALLQEEGVDLIQNTFVLVCDMQYKKRDDAGVWAALGTAFLSAGLGAMGKAQGVDMSQSTDMLNQAAVEMSDLSGFSVIMDAHLLQLQWTPTDLDRLYRNYWVDDATPSVEAQNHKQAFDNASKAFNLEYLGHYKSRSTTIEMQSAEGFDDIILEVTDRTVDKSIKELALMFPQFKPKTPLVHTSNGLVAYVGTKENITDNTKFDVVEPVKKKGEIIYNTVGKLKVMPGTVWDNKNVRMDMISDLSGVAGTRLYSKGNNKYSDQPYMLVESGKSKLNGMKKFTFDYGLRYETRDFSDRIKDQINKSGSTLTGSTTGSTFSLFDFGFTWNINSEFSWNIVEAKLGLLGDIDMGVGTGLTWRFLTLSQKKKINLFVQPTIGFCYLTPSDNSIGYTYTKQYSKQVKYVENGRTRYRTEYYTRTEKGSVNNDSFSYLDWSVRLGINFKKYYLSVGCGPYSSLAFRLGAHF